MRRLALVLAAIVAGCGSGGSTTVTPSSTPPAGGDGSDGGVSPGGGGDAGAGAGGGVDGGGGGGGGVDGGGGGDGGTGAAACTLPTEQLGFGGTGIAVDATTIYYNRWTGKLGPDTLFARNKDLSGSERQVDILDASGTRAHLIVDDANVYALAVGCVARIAKSDGAMTQLGCSNDGFLAVAQDAGAIYALTWGGTVRRVAKSDGAVTDLASGFTHPHGIALAAGTLYFGGDGHILAIATGGGAVTEIVHDAAGATNVAADAAHVYWGDVAGRIWSAPATPGATPTQLAQIGLGVTLLTSDDTRLFWAAQQDATGSYGEHSIDAIEEMRKDGTGQRELEPRVVGIHELTVDDTAVYWTDGTAARHCK